MKLKLLLIVMLSQVFDFAIAQKSVDYSDDVSFEKRASIISIPFDISMDDIQKQVNASLPNLIYEDKSFDDNDKDDLKAKVTRKGDLVFTSIKGDVFYYEVPLKVWVQKRLSLFGMEQTPSTEFELKMRFSSKFSINPDYNIVTVTNADGYEWISKPVFNAGPIELPLAPIVGKIISNKQAGFAAEIDKAIDQNLSLKPYMIDAWNTSMKPLQISTEYNTWLKLTPIETYIVPLKVVGQSLKSTIGFKLFVETLVGTPKDVITPVLQIPNLKIVNAIPDNFEVQLFNVITFSEATAISARMFKGQKYDFKNGKYKIEITDINIDGNDNFMTFAANTTGSFKGQINIKGVPVYDPIRKMIVLSKTELDIKTSNLLHKTAAWLLEGFIEKKIEKDFGLPVSDIIEAARSNTLTAINRDISKGIKMKGEIISIDPKGVKTSEHGIVAIVSAKAKVELIVKGI